MSDEARLLPPFPVDDVTLGLLAHSLEGAIDIDDNGRHIVAGADMTLYQLLDFLSGADHSRVRVIEPGDAAIPGIGGAEIVESLDQMYHPNDVIRALVGEVQRLRARPTGARPTPGGQR